MIEKTRTETPEVKTNDVLENRLDRVPSSREARMEVDALFNKLLDSPETDRPNKEISPEKREKFENCISEVTKGGGCYRDVYKYVHSPEYRETHGEEVPKEVNHAPADCATDIPREMGPCILMDKADHRLTASCGSSKEAKEYQAMQRKLCMEGKFKEAFEMDVNDIQSKFGNKYDDQIAEARAYIDRLDKEGLISGS